MNSAGLPDEEGTGASPPEDLNMKAAYLHVLADALTSVLAIGALLLGAWQGWWFLDPLMGVLGGALIAWWAIGLGRQAGRQLLDVTSSLERERSVRRSLESIDDVRVADLHVWELGPGRASCIVSLVTATPRALVYYQDAVRATVDVAHLTIEVHHCERGHTVR